ncbi:hypothetical protein SERLA73DRAFT_112852 [Serpula lacrymans var. lacrymans S7.3]|uniref:Uncharacterized protein n=1 Tax=Serpula lacrymans var. lacrymans (strain S7.3) TaxID=936435 RepID=F8Q746_SERL3|nr:hypothetical protein SERLA73DRAFT_112852 [Serpula lacrymans var. lacrymans S7.3]
MSTSNWDPVAVKALLRLTTQRLGQLQGKKDSETHNARSDIAALLNKGNVSVARAKTQNLLHDDAIGDVLEVLEMQVGVILERFGELER